MDAPQLGRREKVDIYAFYRILNDLLIPKQDMRMKFTDDDPSAVKNADLQHVDRSQGAARAISVRCLLFLEIMFILI